MGALISLTGAGQMVGPSQKANLEFLFEQVGKKVAGREIQLIMEDDATDPVTGVDKAKKLVTFDKVDVVLGPIHGAVTMAVANYMSTTTTPDIVWMEKPLDVLNMGNKNIFLPWGTEPLLGHYLATYAYGNLGYRTASLVYEDFVSGMNFVDGFANTFAKKGGTIVQKQPIKPGSMDLSPNLAAMKQADVVVYWFTPPLATRFTAQYITAGLKMPLILVLAPQLTTKTLADIGDKTVGILGAGRYTNLIDTPINKSYVENFGKKYGPALIMEQGLCSYVSFAMYLEAVKATNGDTSSAKIIEALKKVKVDTPAGTFSFTPDRLGVGDVYLMQVVKLAEGYGWKVIDKYSQVPMDVPK